MKGTVVFNRKTGQIGLEKNLGETGFKDKGWGDGTREWGSNCAVFPMDPVTFDWSLQVREPYSTDWKPLPKDDPRVQFVALFETIYGAKWHFSFSNGDDDTEINEYCIENEHEIFQQIRKILRS